VSSTSNIPPRWRQLSADAARAARTGDRAEECRLRAEIRAERLAERIKADVDRWPPLTVEQRDRLAALLHAEAVTPHE
jgi:hypothetical protein